MAEFTELGNHCFMAGCNQQDFLPFECDCCQGTFCLPHRGYREHSCPSAGDKDFRAILCPLCKKTIRFAHSQNPNEHWDLHARTECNPQGSGGKTKKKRCASAGCKETLGPTNTQRCLRCDRHTCLKHRFPDSHNCAAAGRAAAVRLAQQPRPMSLREKAVQKARASAAAAQNNTVKASAERRRRNSGTGAAARTDGGGGEEKGEGERCPQCGAGFAHVGALVHHVEEHHSEGRSHAQAQSNWATSTGSDPQEEGGGESCPVCSIWVADAAILVSHVQVEHPEYARADGTKSCCVS